MWTCKHVAKALAEKNYQDLTPFQRWSLKLHVRLCVVCGRFHSQVMDFQDGTRKFLEKEEAIEAKCAEKMCPEARKKCLKSIQDNLPTS